MSRQTLAARICAEQGWAVGDRLEGPTVIVTLKGPTVTGEVTCLRITAIGEAVILARRPKAGEYTHDPKRLVKLGFRKAGPTAGASG